MNRIKHFDSEYIQEHVKRLAKEIDTTYAGLDDRLCIVGVLRGAFIFLADLSRLLNIRHSIDFISIGSYNKDNSGDVRLLMDTRTNVSGKHVLIVEDIVDSGKTINYLVNLFLDKNVASVRTCTLLKRQSSEENIILNFIGLVVPENYWYVGYGLDFEDKYRTLPDIEILDR